MKNKFNLCLLSLLAAICSHKTKAQTPQDLAIQVVANIDRAARKIQLNWSMFAHSAPVVIYKKKKEDLSWTTVANLPSNTTTYTYSLQNGEQDLEFRINHDFRNGSNQITNYCNGYIHAALDLDEIHYRGKMLLVLTKLINDSLKTEVGLAMREMSADGWQVDSLILTPAASVKSVKASIVKWYQKDPINAKSVFLLGNVPVPYSGLMTGSSSQGPADGHTPDHEGAWVADAFYADIDGPYLDQGENTNANRAENKNVAGDGKYDEIELSSTAELQVARVDLSNLPVFGKSEVNLTRQYLQKLSSYKNAVWNIPRKALVDDRLGALGIEYPARAAYMANAPVFGPANISTGQYFTTLKSTPVLMANEFSTGGYQTYIGVGTSSDYKDSIKSVFNSAFGSYFGDWDNSNNILRACLGSPGYTLTNCWNARPIFLFHHMGLGETVGFATKMTMNNNAESGFLEPYPMLFMSGRMHISTLGDPTLRYFMMKPVTNLTVVNDASNKVATLNWQPSPEPGVIGYNIYRSPVWNGKFELIKSRNLGVTFADGKPLGGQNIYMVRAVKLDSSASGTFYNQSIGKFAVAQNLIGLSINKPHQLQFKLYPNPAHECIYIQCNKEERTHYTLTNIEGKEILSGFFHAHFNQIRTQNLTNGIYFLNLINQKGETGAEKIVILHP